MAKFHTLTVKEAIQETSDAKSLSFDIPEELKDTFQYKHGQYLTLRFEIDGKDVRRAYSLCSSPITDGAPKVLSKRVKGGLVSNYINDHVKTGSQVMVFPPMGKFTFDLDETKSTHYVLVSGGSGITPMMSILKTVLEAEPKSRITLIYGNEKEEDIIFKDALTEMAAKEDRFQLCLALNHPPQGWEGEEGRLTQQNFEAILQKHELLADLDQTEFYICGPQPMMDEVFAGFKNLGVPEEKQHVEYFTAPLPDETQKEETADAQASTEAEEDFDESDVTILIEGETHEIKVDKEDTILEVAIEEDIDPPYACQMGICTTCKAKLHEGRVKMDETEGLTEQEIEEGYILTCQSHPTTAKIKLEYEG